MSISCSQRTQGVISKPSGVSKGPNTTTSWRSLVVRTGMFTQKLRFRHDVVVNKDNELPVRVLDSDIAGRRRAPIGL